MARRIGRAEVSGERRGEDERARLYREIGRLRFRILSQERAPDGREDVAALRAELNRTRSRALQRGRWVAVCVRAYQAVRGALSALCTGQERGV